MATEKTPGLTEEQEREKRQRLMDAILDLYPADKEYDYGERYRAYREILANESSSESSAQLAALQGIFTARWAVAMRRWRRLLDESLRREGHSLARWQILFELFHHHPKQTLSSLGSRIGVLNASMVGLLDELERDGLVVRTVDANDRRSKKLTLTPAGEETMSFLTQLTYEMREEFLEDVSEGELRLLLDVVERMNKNLDKMNYLR